MGGAAAGVAIAATAVGTIQGIQAERQAADANRRISRKNAERAREEARLARIQGEEAVLDVQRESERLEGAQRAAFASQGIAVDRGTAAMFQQDVARAAAEDITTIRNNAALRAMGYEFEAEDIRAQSALAQQESRFRQISTFLGGVGRIADIGIRTSRPSSVRRTTRPAQPREPI